MPATELARRAGVSRRSLTEIEAGRANPTLASVVALAAPLRLPLERLLAPDEESLRRGRIALVGLRGAGKSTVGRRLALAREVPFVELDQRVEELAGLSLGALFELHGADHYRALEARALESVLAEGENLVLATGGSIVEGEATFARLRQTCHTVWLRARPADHLARVAAQGDLRPMRGHPRAMDELEALLARRAGAYGQCEFELDTSAHGVEAAVELLLDRFGGPTPRGGPQLATKA